MAKDDDKLIRIFEGLASYRPVVGPAPTQPTLTHPPSWAIGIGVSLPVPPLTGPPPPWPIGCTITPAMHDVCDWLKQHRNERDTDEYRDNYNWLAEQMGLSPDTLEPLRSSPRAPRIDSSPSAPATSPPTEQAAPPTEQAAPPTEQTAERAERLATLAARQASDPVPSTAEAVNVDSPTAVEAADTANVTDRKKRKPGAGNKQKLTDEEIKQLMGALDRKIDEDPKQGSYKNAREFLQHHALPKIMKARAVAKVDKTTVGPSTLDRRVIEPVRRARRERLAISK